MKLSLKSICIIGIVGTALLMLNNLCKLYFPGSNAASFLSEPGMTLGSIIMHSILAAHYIPLTLYLFKKPICIGRHYLGISIFGLNLVHLFCTIR